MEEAMDTVADIVKGKGTEVIRIDSEVSVLAALELMKKKNIGALIVEDAAGEVAGIFSERDFARKMLQYRKKTIRDVKVRELMNERVLCIRAGQSGDECMALMTAWRMRHLPVIEDGKICGLVSIGDIVKLKISEQKFTIEQLENYILGGY
jgi:CBS domain-containing protein